MSFISQILGWFEAMTTIESVGIVVVICVLSVIISRLPRVTNWYKIVDTVALKKNGKERRR